LRTTRKIILFIATSLDGYIAGKNGEIDWLFSDQDYGYSKFISGIDTVLMGRKTYEAILTFDKWPYEKLTTYVFSLNPQALKDPRVIVTSAPASTLVAEIRRNPGKDIYLVGGGELVKSFLHEQLIDEIILGIHPVFLGDGIPLIPPGTRRTPMQLADLKRYDSGLITAFYKMKAGQ
jgi:dihydrofolate reductase